VTQKSLDLQCLTTVITSHDFGGALYRGLVERWMERLWTEGIVT